MRICRTALLGFFALVSSPPPSSFAFPFVVRASSSSASATISRTAATQTCRTMSTTVAAEDTKMSTKTFEETSESYAQLLTKLRTITQLKRASAVLGYDKTVFMGHSDKTVAARGAQMATLAGLIHEKSTESDIADLLKVASADLESYKKGQGETKEEERILEITKKDYEKNQRIPAELEARKAALSSKAYAEWTKARASSDFSSFQSTLQECFDMAQEVATAQRENESVPLYTQMLDEFESGMAAERIEDIFATIQNALVPLLSKVLSSEEKSKPDTAPLKGHFPLPKQEELSKEIVTQLGYDPSHGRIDVSVHPFTTSFSPADVRITSRFNEAEWYQGLAGTIHEGGHAMYEQNLEDSAMDIDSYLSLGCHESQSLFWERHVGLSRSFWKWATPKLKDAFKDFEYDAEQVYRAVNAVSPGFIRVEADELTYPLHVILRYNIERDVIDGKVEVKDIPAKWKEMMKEMIDVDVEKDSDGCLQDVHWSMLAIGYFPTYLLGSATAAQLAHYCKIDIPNFDEKVASGEFGEIKAWLTDKVHRHGKRYKSLDDLLEDQLGEKLNPKYFIDYLTEKYSEIYDC